ncbi:MAG TPA: T9SS type A sorting domain-containing protein [Ignavibacteria bacterium]|nr:T9SS type A sorting domain-containing protein [Ignavibacteria bacterium]
MTKLIKILFILFFTSNILLAESDDKIANRLISFTAKIRGGEVELNWQISNPGNLNKFKIENKKSGTEIYNPLTDVLFSNFRKKTETDSAVSYFYSYSDKPEENGVYFYKISVFDNLNKIIITEEIKVGITEVPEFKLNQNNPNPFNPSTTISYQILVPTSVKLNVYSLTGQFVDILVDAYQTPGTYSVNFNAGNYNEMSSGIYFYKLETNYTSDIKKMIFTK